MPSQHPLQDNYKSETTTAIQTLKSDYATATTTCNQLTQQLDKQQVDQRAELAALQEFHAASLNEQQLEADGLRQQLQAAQARAATAEEQLAALKAASEEDAATITKLQANVAGVAALLAVLACCVTVTDRSAWPTSAAWCFRQLFMCKCLCRQVMFTHCWLCCAVPASITATAKDTTFIWPRCAWCALLSTPPIQPQPAPPELSAAHDEDTAKLSEASMRLKQATEQVSACGLSRCFLLPRVTNAFPASLCKCHVLVSTALAVEYIR